MNENRDLIEKEIIEIQTKDGLSLTATLFKPDDKPKAGVLINSATAVKQGYYEKFALFLAGHGFIVVTYDYRGIGKSSLKNARDSRLSMHAWGEYDLAALIDWVCDRYHDLDWHCVGHSVGGQLVGLAPNNTKLKSVYCVSAQSGYWKHWESLNKAKMALMWYAVVPGVSKALGKLPGFLMGGESLPQGIASQWAYWGRHKDYIVDEDGKPIREGFEQVACAMNFVLIDDDKDFAPPRAVRSLESFYQNADTRVEVISARENSKNGIGHFGFFRKQHESTLWSEALTWMNAYS